MEQAGVALIAQGTNAFGADMKTATKAVDSFGVETKKAADLIQDAAGRWRTASGKFATDAEKAAAGVTTVAPAAKKAGDAAKQAGDDAEKGGRGFDVFGDIVTGAMHKVGEIAIDALAKAAKATAAFIGDSIDLAGDFESGMLNFQAVAGKDVDASGLEEFRDLFLQIGKELPVSTSEVQQAATEMIKGGIDPAIVAAGGLRQNIQFAAAAMEGDLVAAAEISSKILGGWADASATAQQKADFLTHSTDLLTKAANASAVDVKGLSLGIFNAQGIAKTAGVSFDDLTTTLAALAPRFASSSEAGNSLKNMIARLQPTTIPATDAMQALGLYTAETGSAFYDAAGNFVGFEKAAQLLQDSLKGLTKEQQAATLQQIFGNDAMGSAAALADMGAAGYANMAEAMAKANGVAENAALKQQGFNTALDNAKGSVEALQITIGSALMPVLTDLLNNVIAPAVNTFTDMADAIFGNDEAFNRLSPTAQAIVSVLDTLIADVQNIIGAFDDAGAMSSEFGESIGLLASDLGLPGELIQDMVFGIQNLVNWFNAAGGAGDDLGTAITDLSGIWDHLLVVVTSVIAGYQNIAQAVLPIITRFVDEHGTDISAFMKTTWDSIIQIVNLGLAIYTSIVPPVLNAIAGFISDHGSEITKILSGVWEVISSLITGALDTIKGVFTVALAVINGDWAGAWGGIKDIANAQITAISGVIEGFLNAIAGIFDTSLAEIGQTWADNWNAMVNLIGDIGWLEAGNMVVAGIKQGIADAWDSLMGWFSDKVAGLVDAAMDAIGAASPAKAFMPVGAFSVMGIMQGFSDTWPQLTDLVSELSDDLIDQVSDIGQQINGVIADSFGATASIDRQLASNLGKLKDVLPGHEEYITGLLGEAQKEAEAFTDPAEGAKYFKMRSDQIFEIAKLQKEASEAETEEERARIGERLALIRLAHQAEIAQFNANTAANGNPYQDIIDQIQKLFADGMPVNDTGIGHDLMLLLNRLLGIPGYATGGPVKSGQPYWVGEQGPELFWPQMDGMVSPAASSAQMAARANTTNYNGHVGNTFNMPVYTNNSPGALQQSWAIMQASMP